MPEGDTIHRAARTLHQALAGQPITRFETRLVHLARVHDDTPVTGRTVERVTASGKHLLMAFSGGLVLRTHMRMNGSWHLYRPGERWRAPAHALRIRIDTEPWVALAFNVHVAEFVAEADLARHRPVASLGPDLLAPTPDLAEALTRLRAAPDRSVAEALLDQRAVAGIGNVFKSEVLFLGGVHPDTPVGALADETLARLLATAVDLLRANVPDPADEVLAPARAMRRTTRRMDPEARLWVYGRAGDPCRRCGTPIAFRKSGEDARATYWCPRCQTPAST